MRSKMWKTFMNGTYVPFSGDFKDEVTTSLTTED